MVMSKRMLKRSRFTSPVAIVAIAGLGGGLLAAAAAALRPAKFQATVVLSTVFNNRGGGLASQLLGANATGSLQATPGLVVRLTQLQSVLLPIAESRTPSGKVLSDILTGKDSRSLSTAKKLKAMREAITSSYDRETGLVTLQVVNRDSTLARLFVERTVEQISRVFVDASRAQGRQMRAAMSERVDSASSQLRHSEERLASFLSANRSLTAYAAAQAERQRIDRDISLAQTIYTQVLTDREQAIAKELEAAPAVVVLDPLPRSLPTVPRAVVAYALFGAMFGCGVAWVWLLMRAARSQTSDHELETSDA